MLDRIVRKAAEQKEDQLGRLRDAVQKSVKPEETQESAPSNSTAIPKLSKTS